MTASYELFQTAFRHGGFRGWRERRAYHKAASELAFLRQRAIHDGVPVDIGLERDYLRTLGAPDPPPPDPAPPEPADLA